MGTRNLVIVVKDGEYKVAQYGQWDGYPSGQGFDILDFFKSKKRVEKLKKKLDRVRFLDDEKDKEFLEDYNRRCPQWSNEPDNRTREQIHWFETYISRNLGVEILTSISESRDKEILLKNGIDFAGDSLFCEYAYVIDFDTNKLEVYEGFNKKELDENDRFYNMEKSKSSPEYEPVRMIQSYDLDNLPKKEVFEKECSKDEDDEE